MDSDEIDQQDIIGGFRATDIPDENIWEKFRDEGVYLICLKRYQKNTPERQAEKKKFFNDILEGWGDKIWEKATIDENDELDTLEL